MLLKKMVSGHYVQIHYAQGHYAQSGHYAQYLYKKQSFKLLGVMT